MSAPRHAVAKAPAPDPQPASTRHAVDRLPAHVAAAVWRGYEMGSPVSRVVPTGWSAFDRELPGGGWSCHGLVEILAPQPALLEWRLLGPALRQVVAQAGQVVVVGPPHPPHPPGLLHEGLDARNLVWVRAEAPTDRLWATEQLIKSDAAGAIVTWLPQARPAQIRRLQLWAQACAGLVFLCRPEAAQHEASAAPLRVRACCGADWELRVQVLKRRGPTHEAVLTLPSVPGGLRDVLTPRLLQPSRRLQASADAASRRADAEATAAGAPSAAHDMLHADYHALGRPAPRRTEHRIAHR
jgi:protein ImuA